MTDKKLKMTFTCLDEDQNQVAGTIEGSKRYVLDWMRKTFPGIQKSEDQTEAEAMSFFCGNEYVSYTTADGKTLYLAGFRTSRQDEAF